MVFHILDEIECFSEQFGGARSRWVANTIREDDEAFVVCGRADDSWNFPDRKIRRVPLLAKYGEIKKRLSFVPWEARRVFLQPILEAALQDLSPGDVIWVHNRPDFTLALSKIARNRGAKVVLHMVNSFLVEHRRKTTTDLPVDRYVFNSTYLRDEARAKHPEITTSSILSNGADDNCFYPSKSDQRSAHSAQPLITFVGRLSPEKGVHVLLEAMQRLHKDNIPATAQIVGADWFGSTKTTSYIDSLRASAPPNVEFVGFVAGKELGEALRCSDIFCCPSIWQEPFGFVNVEAMASGLPVVASSVGGIPEIFSDGGAVLVPPGNSERLAAELRSLIEKPAERKRLGDQGLRSYRKSYTWPAIRERYREVVTLL